MESPLRKRKGSKESFILGSHVSYGIDDSLRFKKRSKGQNPRPKMEKVVPCAGVAGTGVVMTAPASAPSTVSDESTCRGLKRKLGCIERAAKMGGRKRNLERDYVLCGDIGQGRFGSVRLCRSRSGGEEFACKSLMKNGGESVHREVEIMQHLSGHPGIVTLKGVYEDKEWFHLVIELCSGGRLLDQMMKEGRYSEQKAAELIKEIILVIKYCHEMGVIHRDIKPENILLTASGKLKIADFGLAVRISNGQKLSGIAGSPAYIAPEVLTGNYSEKVDIWAAGVLLHALLVGVLPFQGDSLDVVFEAIKNMELDFHKGVWESTSDLVRDLVSHMLTRDVASRMSAAEVLYHPWILFYTERPPRALLPANKSSSRGRGQQEMAAVITTDSRRDINNVSSLDSLPTLRLDANAICDGDDEDCCFVDALTVAISRMKISQPKRSRVCSPAAPISQQCSSSLKANLCTAF